MRRCKATECRVNHFVGDSEHPRFTTISENGDSIVHEWDIPIDSDAIRAAGIRCETCEHFGPWNLCDASHSDTPAGGEVVLPNFFCAHHSALTKEVGSIYKTTSGFGFHS